MYLILLDNLYKVYGWRSPLARFLQGFVFLHTAYTKGITLWYEYGMNEGYGQGMYTKGMKAQRARYGSTKGIYNEYGNIKSALKNILCPLYGTSPQEKF